MTTASLCGPNCGAPLFVHVFGALLLFGGVLAVATLSFAALRQDQHAPLLRRLAFLVTLAVVWPAFVLMRVGAEWVLSHEGLDKNSPGWVGVGFVVSDAGVVVLLLLTLFGWLAARRARAGPLLAGFATAYLVALVVAWWAMTTKPGA